MGLVEVINPLVGLAPGTVVGLAQEIPPGHVMVGADLEPRESRKSSPFCWC